MRPVRREVRLELSVLQRDPVELGLDLEALSRWLEAVGPVAVVDLETTGLPESRSSEIIEIGILLLDPGAETVGVFETFVRPRRPIPSLITRLTGLVDDDVASAPRLIQLREGVRDLLEGRTILAHQAEFERSFLQKEIDASLFHARYLDTQDLLAMTHPDAPDLRLETFTRMLLGREEQHRALHDAIDAAEVVSKIGAAARLGEPRYAEAHRILLHHLPSSAWRALLQPAPFAFGDGASQKIGEQDFDFVAFARSASEAASEPEPEPEPGAGGAAGKAAEVANGDQAGPLPEGGRRFLEIGRSGEEPVPFEMEAIVAALSDAERGERHFPGYRVREEQLELAREFVHVFEDGGIAKLEGGTGVGKSLAYLAAAIPYAMARSKEGSKEPVVLSTRTKLLQDQLLRKDIAAAARFLGYPDLRALSIKGRANYVCERRLSAVLGEAKDPTLLDDLKTDYALLEACARIRPNGEIGTVPAALLRRHPKVRELLRASVAVRAEHCGREQCAVEKACPFGRHRRALARAHLVVANHDLLLRWPPDYPSFSHVVMDEGHEVGDVAEEVYALRVRPEDVAERLDELFGAPVRRGQKRYASSGLVAAPETKSEDQTLRQNRRDLMLELIGLGRAMGDSSDAFGGVELSLGARNRFPTAAGLASGAALRLEAIAAHATRLGPFKRLVVGEDRDGAPTAPERDLDAEEETQRAIAAHAEALLGAAHCLRMAFGETSTEGESETREADGFFSEGELEEPAWIRGSGREVGEAAVAPASDYVGAFEGLESPYDRWSLVLRPVAPGDSFREEFLGRVEGLAVVSATLFVGDDDHPALGDLGLAGAGDASTWSRSVGSPFPYEQAMRVVALDSDAELVEETAQTLAILARRLRGRTLGLFTSLARMRDTADRLSELLEGEGIEVLLPRRSGDDPGALVDRFRKAKGGAVLLGARRFWQGIDVRGDDLQAVVIEKLPFDVPTELRKRRDERMRAAGDDPFSRGSLGRMLLHLKQMSGRLIRSETDRGLVVIVDARRDRGYFRRLSDAIPEGTKIEIAPREDLPRIADELNLG